MFRRFVDWLNDKISDDIKFLWPLWTVLSGLLIIMLIGVYATRGHRQAELRCLRAGYPEVRVSGFIDPVYYCVRIQDGAHQVVRLDAIPECHCED